MHELHTDLIRPGDRLQLLEVFLAVAETKSLTSAARRLGLSQPTISRMLQRLESVAGVRLVRRLSRGVALTSEGEQLVSSAPLVMASWSGAMEGLRSPAPEFSGKLRVVAPVALGQGSLAIILSRFLMRHPRLSLDLELRDDPIDLMTSKYDLWVRAGGVHENLVVRHVFQVPRFIVAAPTVPPVEHPRSLKGLRAIRLRPFVPRSIKLTHGSGDIFQLSQSDVLTSEHLETVRLAALEGVGYAVLPLWAVKSDLEKNSLIRLCPEWNAPTLSISLAFPPNPRKPARVEALIRFLRDELTKPDGIGMSYLLQRNLRDTIQIC